MSNFLRRWALGLLLSLGGILSPVHSRWLPTSWLDVSASPPKRILSNLICVSCCSLSALTVDYLSDGVYGSFNCILYDHQNPIPKLLSHEGRFYYDNPPRPNENGGYKCSIWGPTCDGLDCIAPSYKLPVVLEIGDWLYFENMGAYTICAATCFNGFRASQVLYVNSEACIEEFLE